MGCHRLGRQSVQFLSSSDPDVSGKSHIIRSESNPRLPQWSGRSSVEQTEKFSLIKSFHKWAAFGRKSKSVQMVSAEEGSPSFLADKMWKLPALLWGWAATYYCWMSITIMRAGSLSGHPVIYHLLARLATINHNPPSLPPPNLPSCDAALASRWS